jgi:hypothetical protein
MSSLLEKNKETNQIKEIINTLETTYEKLESYLKIASPTDQLVWQGYIYGIGSYALDCVDTGSYEQITLESIVSKSDSRFLQYPYTILTDYNSYLTEIILQTKPSTDQIETWMEKCEELCSKYIDPNLYLLPTLYSGELLRDVDWETYTRKIKNYTHTKNNKHTKHQKTLRSGRRGLTPIRRHSTKFRASTKRNTYS